MEEESDVLIFDTGGGRNGTIKRLAWNVFDYTKHKHRLLGYQDKSEEKLYPFVATLTIGYNFSSLLSW